MQNDEITGEKIKSWREKRGLNLDELGHMLGGVTGPTISRWENGQDIPGPAKLLLCWLIDGKVPFGQAEGAENFQAAAWKLDMTLEAWEKLDGIRIAEGHATMTDFIASLVMAELEDNSTSSRTIDGDDMGDMALLADRPSDPSAGADSAVQAALETAARAFLAEPPGPAAPAPKRGRYTAPVRRGSGRSSRGLSD